MKIIISGGGTGGHIFPSIAIANACRKRWNNADILFIGAEGRMEMEKVPAAGYEIIGLPIAGLQRKLTLPNIIKNLQLPFKVLRSKSKVKDTIRSFNPDIVVGVGGYASQPTLSTAAKMGYKTLLQEQNSYAGLTNKMLSKEANTICVAYEGMESFFPKEKIVFTGNPVRADIENISLTKEQACEYFNIPNDGQVLLSVGGSLGARSINEMIMAHLSFFVDNKIHIIWQTGKTMYEEAKRLVEERKVGEYVHVHKFIDRMDMAYTIADVIISRAGAIAISELSIVAKPLILIPSPNVAEDHQTHNAMALVDRQAAILVKDSECKDKCLPIVADLLADSQRQTILSANLEKMAVRGAADKIVDEIERLTR